jgi:hypothetical protein
MGPGREPRWALERRWSGRSSPDNFGERLNELRAAHLAAA